MNLQHRRINKRAKTTGKLRTRRGRTMPFPASAEEDTTQRHQPLKCRFKHQVSSSGRIWIFIYAKMSFPNFKLKSVFRSVVTRFERREKKVSEDPRSRPLDSFPESPWRPYTKRKGGNGTGLVFFTVTLWTTAVVSYLFCKSLGSKYFHVIFLLVAINSFLILIFQGMFRIILQKEINCLNMLFVEES